MGRTDTHNIVTKRVLNEDTGELEQKDFKEIKNNRKKIRGGFNMIYHKNYEEVLESVVKSQNDIILFNWITNKFTHKKTIVSLSYKDLQSEISQPQFSRMIKKLTEQKYIFRIQRGLYKLNPFIYLPYKANAEELQKEWKELTE